MAEEKTDDTILTEDVGKDGKDKNEEDKSGEQKTTDIFKLAEEKKVADEKKTSTDDDKKDDKKDDKTADKADKKSEDTKSDKDKRGAPEAYTAFTVPEHMEIDPDILAEVTPLLKDANMSQDQAQKFVDLQVKVSQSVLDAQAKQWADQRAKWRSAGQDDERFGKGNYDKNLTIARKGMLAIGGSKLVEALKETGMGDHPEFFNLFWEIGKAVGEDSLAFGEANAGGGKSLAQRIFPKHS